MELTAEHHSHAHTRAVKVPGPKASQQDGGDRVIGAEVGVRDQVEEEGHLAQGCFFRSDVRKQTYGAAHQRGEGSARGVDGRTSLSMMVTGKE